MRSLAPIILFVYNRPEHTFRTLTVLCKNPEAKDSHLFIFADGPKDNASESQKAAISKTRALVRSKKWCASVTISEASGNMGLAASVIDGVNNVIGAYGKAIVLEDDHETSSHFLEFMNAALHRYEQEKRVACISGYVYPLTKKSDKAFFIKGADCWGWATWADRWKLLQNDAQRLKKEILARGLYNDFTFNDSYPYMKMLEDRAAGLNQSWAILWYATALINAQLCLYPPASLVHNTGNDGSGTHTADLNKDYDIDISHSEMPLLPSVIEESSEGRREFESFFLRAAKAGRPHLLNRVISKLKGLFAG